MISLLLASSIFAHQPRISFEAVLLPEIKQIETSQNRNVQVSKAFTSLPAISPKVAQLSIGDNLTKVYVPLTSAVSIAGFDKNQRPYLNVVSVSHVGSKLLAGSGSIIPRLGGYTPLSVTKTSDWVEITDVNRHGHLAINCHQGGKPTPPNTAYMDGFIPEASVLRNGKRFRLGRTYDLKLNDRGDLAGVTAVPVDEKGYQLFGFSDQKGKRKLIGKGNHALLTEDGDVLVFESRLVTTPNGGAKQSFTDAVYWSKGAKTAFTTREGLIPVAIWSKSRYIAHEKEGSEKFFLHENGRYLDLQSITSTVHDFRISQVHRVYSDGSIWASLSDNEGTSYPALLIPRT